MSTQICNIYVKNPKIFLPAFWACFIASPIQRKNIHFHCKESCGLFGIFLHGLPLRERRLFKCFAAQRSIYRCFNIFVISHKDVP